MPRVSTHTKSPRETKRPYRCERCAQAIEPGQRYFKWALRSPGARSGTVFMQHVECGRPRPSQLSRRKTAQIEDAILDAEKAIGEWSLTLDEDGEYSPEWGDIESALSDVAGVARDVGQEYQDGFDAMPEGLQQGDVAQALEQVAQELDSWADDLESFDPDSDMPDWPNEPDEDDEGNVSEDDKQRYERAREQALYDWMDEVRSKAQDMFGDMPQYEG